MQAFTYQIHPSLACLLWRGCHSFLPCWPCQVCTSRLPLTQAHVSNWCAHLPIFHPYGTPSGHMNMPVCTPSSASRQPGAPCMPRNPSRNLNLASPVAAQHSSHRLHIHTPNIIQPAWLHTSAPKPTCMPEHTNFTQSDGCTRTHQNQLDMHGC